MNGVTAAATSEELPDALSAWRPRLFPRSFPCLIFSPLAFHTHGYGSISRDDDG